MIFVGLELLFWNRQWRRCVLVSATYGTMVAVARTDYKGILMSLQMVMFAYLGVEMIGVTAGEAKNPKTISRKSD